MQNSKLLKEDILHVAKLANLEIAEGEVEKFQKQLEEILEYVSQIQKVNTDGIEPTSQVTGLENITREDNIIDTLTPEQALLGAKKKKGQLFEAEAIKYGL